VLPDKQTRKSATKRNFDTGMVVRQKEVIAASVSAATPWSKLSGITRLAAEPTQRCT